VRLVEYKILFHMVGNLTFTLLHQFSHFLDVSVFLSEYLFS
jgi:hypothetical protein